MGHDTYDFPKKQTNPFVSEPHLNLGTIVNHCLFSLNPRAFKKKKKLVAIHAELEFY